MALRLARLDRAGEMDRASVEEQLLGERRLARLRLRGAGFEAAYFKFNDTGQ